MRNDKDDNKKIGMFYIRKLEDLEDFKKFIIRTWEEVRVI